MQADLTVARVEVDAILALRSAVLSEPGQPVSSLPRDRWPTTRHWAATLEGSTVGCVSVVPLRGYALRAMAVLPAHQRRGVGAGLLQAVYAQMSDSMWCNSRHETVPFYAAMGWLPVGPVFDIDDRGLHQRMVWSAGGRQP